MSIRDSSHSQKLNSSSASVEQLYISSSTCPETNRLLRVAYITPDATIAKCIDYSSAMEEVIVSQLHPFSHIFLMGDINQPDLDWNNQAPISLRPLPARTLCDLISSHSLSQINSKRNSRGVILDAKLSSGTINTNLVRDDDPLVKEDVHHPALSIHLHVAVISRSAPSSVPNL